MDKVISAGETAVFRFIWTKTARDILQKVIRANSHLRQMQH
ncbi:hypothetical protein SIL73_05840 [Acidithiobacillus thiooxidans]|nr:hypothetical protein [Acidithiobacillus thiooxidans]MDX5934213.1 hypothetical protein [Acidithiobacillus thiooxidans]